MIDTPSLRGEDQFCTTADGLQLCYRVYGPAGGQPLVLVVGLSLQLIYWPAALIQSLVAKGHRVLVMDNRDIGRSSQIQQPPPETWRIALRKPRANAYDLRDMAQDVLTVMDAAGMAKAHVAGMSMGGMIAQTLAAHHPERCLSLISIFSTTGARAVGQPNLTGMSVLLKPPRPGAEGFVQDYVSKSRAIGPRREPLPHDELVAYAQAAWARSVGPAARAGVARQIEAVLQSGDRTADLRRITAPTLVIHGDRDPMVAPSGGAATARAIAGAQLLTIHDMGHFIGSRVSPLIADLISGHAHRHAAA